MPFTRNYRSFKPHQARSKCCYRANNSKCWRTSLICDFLPWHFNLAKISTIMPVPQRAKSNTWPFMFGLIYRSASSNLATIIWVLPGSQMFVTKNTPGMRKHFWKPLVPFHPITFLWMDTQKFALWSKGDLFVFQFQKRLFKPANCF